jgi:hypothetical protein
MTTGKTYRGFDLVEFRDKYGEKCSLQKSSIATEDCIWFGTDEVKPQILASKLGVVNPETGEMTGWVDFPIPKDVQFATRMHLTQDMVKELLPYLIRFAETGELS